ncbi:non-ribosomal peptide synthetase/MFS transporter [Herbidospora cretacea]|uniref:non-ribosomal peptide synthetase/MFS transporter n=1 Tax=Herbidospora cretacea TaxID=28444 RepID=UPI001FE2264B|nr:non-ribosomal peptide synthetase [Herbidospora cretacea]
MTSLSPAKQALLSRRLQRRAVAGTIAPRSPEVSPPLSHAQERLWFLEHYRAGTTAYTIPFTARLTGALDEHAFAAAVTEVSRRHESLRMRFLASDDGLPEVVVDEDPATEFVFTEAAGEAAARELMAATLDRPFDLTAGGLLRVLLVRLAPDDHVILMAAHHAVTDGWSGEILLRELLTLHAGEALDPLPIQYGDYALWERTRDHAGDLAYWRERLAGVPPLELPLDLPRPAEQTTTGRGHRFRVDTALLNRFADQGVTPYMAMLAALQITLGKWSGQRDFAVGSPVSGRPLPELEPLAGMFVNTLAMRADLSGDPTFGEYLVRVRDSCLDAYAHQELPFDKLVGELRVERDVSRSAVFQVLLAHQGYQPPGDHGLKVSAFHPEVTVSRFDLAFYLWDDDGLVIYNPDLFHPETVARLTESLTAVLATAPGTRLSEVDWVPDEAGVLALGVAAPAEPLPARLLHELLPVTDATAVVLGGDALTYRELDARANRLAHRLQSLGVRPGDRVAVCLDQSTGLAVALLGVLKAGAAYVPLDPEQPDDRLAYLIADSGIRVSVTERALPGGTTGTAPLVDGPDTPVTSEVTPGDLAYVIYTSGTTGRPKGVAVQHREVLTYLSGVRERFGIEDGKVFALPQSLAFDFGVTVFYLSLMTGGTLHLIPPKSTDPWPVRPDYLKMTPSHLAALDVELPKELLILGGEASAIGWAGELAQHCRVVNHYGPTEATVGVTTYEVPPGQTGQTTVPIGRPLPGARVYVLDEHMRPVPAGVTGEIYLGGDRLARGYLGKPALTAEKFLPDPFGPPGSRVYRTGDLGRWTADGVLQFLGRRDLQVKIRGYRVELSEVETVLAEHPSVMQAVVELRDQRLVAYLVGDDVPAADVRAWVKERLPDYMVPARWVWLDALPLKSHGKVDRAALPSADEPPQTGLAEPETEAEETIAAIWAAVLGLERVGVTDDFFDLGGHSLLAMQVVARMRKAGHPITLMQLFTHPTVRDLARSDAGSGGLLHRLTPARPVTASLVCAPYGGGSAVVYKPLADAMPAGWALHSIAVPGHELGEEPRPFEEVAEEAAAEILATVEGRIVLYGHCGAGTTLVASIARRLEAAGRPAEAIYLGGVFPFTRPRGLFARFGEWLEDHGSDQSRINGLVAAGLDVAEFEQAELELIVQNRRRGTREAERYFARLFEEGAPPLSAPVIAVAGERDPVVEFYQERYREWHCLSQVTACVVLDEAAHYFVKYRAEELATILTTVHPDLDVEDSASLQRAKGSDTWWVEGVSRVTPGQPAGLPGADGPAPSMKRFLVLAAGQLVSMTGSALTEFAIPLWIYLETGSLANFALFSVLGLLPGLLAAPLAGAVVDRFSRRAVLMGADIAAGSSQLALGLLVWTGTIQIWHVYPLLVTLSIALTFQRVAYASAIPQIVPKRFLGHANGVVGMATGVAQLVVPLVAAGLLAVVGLGGILVIDVVSYVVAISVLAVIRFPRTMAWRRRETVLKEMAEGFRYTWGHLGIRRMLLFFAVVNLFMSPLFLLVSPLVLSFAELGDVGRVTFFGGLGVFLGGLAMTFWGGPRRLRLRGQLLATLSLSCFALVIGARESLVVIAIGVFGMFASLTVLNGIYNTIIQVKVPQRFHGRVFALNQLVAFSTLPIGYGLIAPYGTALFEPLMADHGPLASTVGMIIGTGEGRGIALMYVLFALVMAAAVVVGTRMRRLWNFDLEVPDAIPDDVIGFAALHAKTRSTEEK